MISVLEALCTSMGGVITQEIVNIQQNLIPHRATVLATATLSTATLTAMVMAIRLFRLVRRHVWHRHQPAMWRIIQTVMTATPRLFLAVPERDIKPQVVLAVLLV